MAYSVRVSAISRFGMLVLCFGRFLLTTIPGHAILLLSCVLRRKLLLHRRAVLYILAATCYWMVAYLLNPSPVVITHVLFYSGFIIPWVAFSNSAYDDFFSSNRYIVTVCVLIIIETALANSPLLRYLYFFPPEGSTERTQFFGFYQRPLGIAGNASMTSGVLLFSLALRDYTSGNKRLVNGVTALTFLAILLLASGAGFLFFVAYLAMHYLRVARFTARGLRMTLVCAAVVAVFVAYGAAPLSEIEDFDKASTKYFSAMYESKMKDVQGILERSEWLRITLGNQSVRGSISATSGDFGYLTTLNAIGVVGWVLVVLAPLLFIENIVRVIVPTVFFYLSFIHYPGLLSPPGQIAFAYYMCLLARARKSQRGSVESGGSGAERALAGQGASRG